MNSNIQRHTMTTAQGNTLSFFYNPDNNLVVVDLVRKDEKGGNELLRQTLDEKNLLTFRKRRAMHELQLQPADLPQIGLDNGAKYANIQP